MNGVNKICGLNKNNLIFISRGPPTAEMPTTKWNSFFSMLVRFVERPFLWMSMFRNMIFICSRSLNRGFTVILPPNFTVATIALMDIRLKAYQGCQLEVKGSRLFIRNVLRLWIISALISRSLEFVWSRQDRQDRNLASGSRGGTIQVGEMSRLGR